MIWEFFKAVFLMGLPLGVLTLLLVRWSLAIEAHTPGDGDLALSAWLKSLKKKPKKGRKSANKVHDKWMRFGGGFYGCMAVFTYLYVEAIDIYNFVRNFAGLENWFDKIGVDMIVQFFISSLTNFLDAILWFAYWPDQINTDAPLVWLAAAYLGYLAGAHLAWHEAAGTVELPTADTIKAYAGRSYARMKASKQPPRNEAKGD